MFRLAGVSGDPKVMPFGDYLTIEWALHAVAGRAHNSPVIGPLGPVRHDSVRILLTHQVGTNDHKKPSAFEIGTSMSDFEYQPLTEAPINLINPTNQC